MVLNPYRTSNTGSLPVYHSSTNHSQGWFSWLLGCISCGLLTKRSSILRLAVVLFIITLGLISYYFHLHFTHPTLLSENIPNVKGNYDLSRFKPDLFNSLRGGSPSTTTTTNMPPDSHGKFHASEKKKAVVEDLAEKDPIAYNPNHFHRYREPLKEEKEDAEKQKKEKEHKENREEHPIEVVDEQKENERREKNMERIAHDIEEVKRDAVEDATHQKPPAKLAEIVLNVTHSHSKQMKKDDHPIIHISSHPDDAKEEKPKDDAIHISSHPDPIHISSHPNPTQHKQQQEEPAHTDQHPGTPVPVQHPSDEKAATTTTEHKGDVIQGNVDNSALKQRLMEKLKQMKDHKPDTAASTTTTDNPIHDHANQPIHLDTGHNTIASNNNNQQQQKQQQKPDFKYDSHDVSTVQKPATAYDLPSDIVQRIETNNHNEGGTDSHAAGDSSHGSRGDVKPKVDYCAENIDPFEKIPVDRFVPPKAAPFEEITMWKKRINDFVKSISKLKIGGEALREKLENDVTDLKILRFKTFCKYA